MAYCIEESITIEAPINVIWALIKDFPNWSSWNSFVISATVEGSELVPGASTTIQIKPERTSKPSSYTNTILNVSEATDKCELRWHGSFIAPIVLNTEHWCSLTRIEDNSSIFTQGEKFTGLLVPVAQMSGTLAQLQEGYVRMNNDLKLAAEAKFADLSNGGSLSQE